MIAAKTDEPVEMPFGMWTRVGKKQCIRWAPSLPAIGAVRCKVYGHSVVSCPKTVEPIDMPFEVLTVVGTKKHVSLLDGGTHWCHLANTIEPSMCSGDAAFWQITLSS